MAASVEKPISQRFDVEKALHIRLSFLIYYIYSTILCAQKFAKGIYNIPLSPMMYT